VLVVRPSSVRPVVLGLGALLLTGWLVLRTLGGPSPAPVEIVAGTPVPVPSASGSAVIATPASPSPGPLVVHVVGEVRRPGLVRLAPGSRVADALSAAGGLVAGGSSGGLNLARPVVDGEQIVVTAEAVAAPASSVPGSGAGSVVDLNTATVADLDTLPGVGPVLAARILEWREQHGRFAAVEQLREVSGIGARTFERLAPLVRI
jgi:competence protein ComEA